MTVCTCGKLELFISEGKLPLHYSPRFREYSIRLTDNVIQNIYFCPWCGDKLPESLRDKWFDNLEELGFYNPFQESLNSLNFPEEYKTDLWWKKI